MDRITTIDVFLKVADARSFTRAAAALSLSPAAVSRAVSELETRLGARLLNRTTRSVSLTFDGEHYAARCRQLLADLEEADAVVRGAAQTLRGRLRVQLPVGLGRHLVLPALPAFSAQHPGIVLDVELGERMADLAEENLDVVVRIGQLAESRLVARPLGAMRYLTCASPDHLRRHGTPRSPVDLKTFNCMAYIVPQTKRYREWEYMRDGQPVSVAVSGSINLNNAEELKRLAIQGVGLIRLADFVVADAVGSGQLSSLLDDWSAPGKPIHAVMLASRSALPRVHAFVRFLQDTLAVTRHRPGGRPGPSAVAFAEPG